MPALKVVFLAMKAQQGWKRIPPEQRRRILAAAQSSAKKHGPTVARAVRDQGPTVAKAVREQGPSMAKQLGRALRGAKKRP
jgi:acyl-CoA reductase-like NAD-dependent aldehyde dehydrogenase